MNLFDSAIRPKGDLAGVFEYDEAGDPQAATAYFYLCQIQDSKAGPVIDAIHIRSGSWTVADADIAVRWDNHERRVGVFIFGVLWAAFDTATGMKYGGGFGRELPPDIPWS